MKYLIKYAGCVLYFELYDIYCKNWINVLRRKKMFLNILFIIQNVRFSGRILRCVYSYCAWLHTSLPNVSAVELLSECIFLLLNNFYVFFLWPNTFRRTLQWLNTPLINCFRGWLFLYVLVLWLTITLCTGSVVDYSFMYWFCGWLLLYVLVLWLTIPLCTGSVVETYLCIVPAGDNFST